MHRLTYRALTSRRPLWAAGLLLLILAGCVPLDSGRIALHRGVAKLKKALVLESSTPDDPTFQAALAKAVGQLERAREHLPDSPSVHLNLGVAYWKQRRTADAVKALEKAAALRPQDSLPYEFLGCAYASVGLWEDVREALDLANQRESYSPRILTAMAVAELRSGHTEMSLLFLEQALLADPNYAPALYNMALMQQDKYEDQEKAGAYYTQFLGATAEQKRPFHSSSRDRMASQNRISRAQDFLSPPPPDDPTDPDLPQETEPSETNRLAVVSETTTEPTPSPIEPVAEEAETEDDATPTRPPTPAAPSRELTVTERAYQAWGKGLAAQQAGDAPQAIRHYKQALAIKPDMEQAVYNLGLAYKANGQLHEARDAFHRMLELNRTSTATHYMLGLIYRQLHQDYQAIQHLDQVLSSGNEFPRAHFVLGLIYRGKAEKTLARIHFEHFIRLAPNDPFAEQARAYLK